MHDSKLEEESIEDRLQAAGFTLSHETVWSRGELQVNTKKLDHAERCLDTFQNTAFRH